MTEQDRTAIALLTAKVDDLASEMRRSVHDSEERIVDRLDKLDERLRYVEGKPARVPEPVDAADRGIHPAIRNAAYLVASLGGLAATVSGIVAAFK